MFQSRLTVSRETCSAFTLHVMGGQAAQLLVDDRQQRVECVRFAPVPGRSSAVGFARGLGMGLILLPYDAGAF